MNETDRDENQTRAIASLVKGYNKSIVLNSVTRHSMDIIGESLDAIGGNLSTIVTAFEEIRASSQSTARNTEKIDSMMGSIVRNNASNGADIRERVVEIGRTVEGAVRLGTLFKELSEKAESITAITGSIQDVSDRTNILAINASIEAARAGTVGKGFRIIANEVRTLANQTGDFAHSIDSTMGEFSSTVKEISGAINGFTATLARFKDSFNHIEESYGENARAIDEAGSFLGEINGSYREEAEALNSGLSSLEGISVSLKDTQVVANALLSTYSSLDKLLEKGS